MSFVMMLAGCDVINKITGGEDHVHSGGNATFKDLALCDECGESYGDYAKIVIDWVIEAAVPTNGADICLANERISCCYAGYDFRTTDTDVHWLEADIFVPNVPVLKWTL